MNDRNPVLLRCSLVLFRQEAILLCRRADRGGTRFVLPGGTPHQGEGAAACARRETREETGLAAHAGRVAFVLETSNSAAGQQLIEIVFLGEDEEPSALPVQREDHLRPEFVPLSTLHDLAAADRRPPAKSA